MGFKRLGLIGLDTLPAATPAYRNNAEDIAAAAKLALAIPDTIIRASLVESSKEKR